MRARRSSIERTTGAMLCATLRASSPCMANTSTKSPSKRSLHTMRPSRVSASSATNSALAVAQALLAEILDRSLDAAGQLVARHVRADRLAGVGELGEARGDVHAVAQHVEGLDDHLGDVNADAQAERRRPGQRVGAGEI